MSLWRLTSGQRLRYGWAMGAMALGAVFLLSVPAAIKAGLDRIESGGAFWNTVAPMGAAVIILHVLHGFFTYLRGKWAAEASEGIVARLRRQLYSHLERLPCGFHDLMETGDVVQRCSSDVETVRVFMSSQVVEIARISLLVLIAVPIMLTRNARMTLICMSLTPIIVLFAVLFFRQVRRLFQQVDEAEGQLTTVIQENLTGVRVVRAFAQQDLEIEKFRQRNGVFRDLEFRLFLAMSNYWAASNILCFGQVGIALVAGGSMALRGEISVGTWVFFFWMVRTIIWPIRQMGRVLAEMGKATVAIRRINEILTAPTENDAAASNEPTRHEPLAGAIEFDNVSFQYAADYPELPASLKAQSKTRDSENAERESSESSESGISNEPSNDVDSFDSSDERLQSPGALESFSLQINQGETVAIMGPPGSGKSTLVRLLLRLYEYDQGEIRIGGVEIRHLHRDRVRSLFGVVLQDPFLYSKTVRDNMTLAQPNADDATVEGAAADADVAENIRDFPKQYDTAVGERGVTLSGGQRQRLAIARALLKDPDYLILDDSLSAVDTKTESKILNALSRRSAAASDGDAAAKRTTILITHRLSSTRMADRVIMMERGRIVQQGRHEDLIQEEGPYRRLCEIQGELDAQIQRHREDHAAHAAARNQTSSSSPSRSSTAIRRSPRE